VPRVVNLRTCLSLRGELPPGTVRVDRATKWGNPYRLVRGTTRRKVIEEYERWLRQNAELLAALPELRGKDLACWCAPKACHADVLLRLANKKG